MQDRSTKFDPHQTTGGVMGKAVPEQHPAVVLRSHYVHLRALLVAALIALVGLTATVVIVANDDEATVSTSTPAPAAIEYGGTGATGVPESAPLPQRKLDGATDVAPAPRYDGGPNEGGADITPGVNLPARPNQAQAYPGAAQQAGQVGQTKPGATRYDGGPNEGSADVTMSPPIGHSSVQSQSGPYRYDGGPNEGSADVQLKGSKASANPQTGTPRYDGGPNEGSADVTAGGGRTSVTPQTDRFHYSGD
jgi:hypothetical protein